MHTLEKCSEAGGKRSDNYLIIEKWLVLVVELVRSK